MGKKWGSNEDIHIGDIFRFMGFSEVNPVEYYQVVALRGKTQVVLRAIESEQYINEGIDENSPLYWRRERMRPLPGQFIDRAGSPVYCYCKKNQTITVYIDDEVTAWVLPDRMDDDTPKLRTVGRFGSYGGVLWLEQPKDWEPWDAETIRKLEEYERQTEEVHRRHLHGEEDVPWPEYPI